MEISIVGVILATIAQFAIGAIWYTFIFGKIWGKIHGFDALDKETQQAMMKQMGPLYGLQFLVTVFSSVVLAILIKNAPSLSPYTIAFSVWAGFIVPTQVSDAIFGGTKMEWLWQKLAILAGASLLCVLAAAWILTVI